MIGTASKGRVFEVDSLILSVVLLMTCFCSWKAGALIEIEGLQDLGMQELVKRASRLASWQ